MQRLRMCSCAYVYVASENQAVQFFAMTGKEAYAA